ncbi:hypothetical protein Q5752_004798 [Cryptotrichosporon argae]
MHAPAASAAVAPVVGRRYLISRLGELHSATVLDRRVHKGVTQIYISFAGQDKRLDAWVPEADVGARACDEPVDDGSAAESSTSAAARARAAREDASTPEREHAALTRVRNFEDVRFGEYLIRTWYYSPYPVSAEEPTSKKRKAGDDTPQRGKEGARGRLWVCDLCFKYMRHRASWETHTASCAQLRPSGRKVYQRGSYSIFEVDGATATLYCQNLSLFGKLFIDHKSLFFHVENFLFYVLCDAATSKRDQVLAFFSKEKVSYDDCNLACIVAFPPFQNRGFGKLLIEFSYHLTRHPSTRLPSGSPGTPERPLSDLGLKGYTAFWAAVVLRACRALLADAPVPAAASEGRALRSLRRPEAEAERFELGGVPMTKTPLGAKGQYAVATTLADLARACHLRTDDVALTLTELGFLKHRRMRTGQDAEAGDTGQARNGEWSNVEVVISKEAVEDACRVWRVKDAPLLDENYVLL